MVDPKQAAEYFRQLMKDKCCGCDQKDQDYSGEKTYVVASFPGAESFTAWLCEKCAERLQSQAAAFWSQGYVVIP